MKRHRRALRAAIAVPCAHHNPQAFPGRRKKMPRKGLAIPKRSA